MARSENPRTPKLHAQYLFGVQQVPTRGKMDCTQLLKGCIYCMLHPTPFRAAAREVFLTHVLSSFITVVIVISCYANNCYVAINNLAMPLVFTTCREYQIGLAIDPRIKFVTRPFLAGRRMCFVQDQFAQLMHVVIQSTGTKAQCQDCRRDIYYSAFIPSVRDTKSKFYNIF